MDIFPLLGEHASAFFLIKKNDSARVETFATRRSNGTVGIRPAEGCRVAHFLQFGIQSAVE
jgi:hypothetical protein